MAATLAPRSQVRLLRTYGGLGGGGGGGRRRRGLGRGARSRVAAAPWFSPPRERRRLFSSSSGSGLSAGSPGCEPASGCSSPTSAPESDPDFEPGPAWGDPGASRQGRRRRLRLRAKAPREDLEEEEEEAAEAAAAKENRPHPFVTERSWKLRSRGRRPGPPLCSTPGQGPEEKEPEPEPRPGLHSPSSCLVRSVLADLSPVRNLSPAPAGLGTSASLFSPAPAPARRRPRRRAARLPRDQERPRRAPPDTIARKACISGCSSARWAGAGPRRFRARASLSFHKRKVVAELQPPGTPDSSFVLLDAPGTPGSAPWHSSSLYLLTPNPALPAAALAPSPAQDSVLSDADKVYQECQQEGPLAFDLYLAPHRIQSCEKIGEGVFGEVFRAVLAGRTTALKVIAIEGAQLVNGSPQKSFGEILAEIIISKELSLLAEEPLHRTEGFIALYASRCVRGSYPDLLLQAWDAFHRLRGSDNERPDFFGNEQLYVVLEFEFGGVDLEHMRKQLPSVAAAKSLLHQVTAALAVAEAALHFEHRDLHWGNVLVKRTSAKELGYTLNGQAATIATHGIHVNIIDYTLSRLEKDGLVVFCDISQEQELFQGEGDYQFDIYRLMKKRTRNRWAHYEPYSNVLWLHYLADKLLRETTFKRKASSAAMRQVKRQIEAFYQSVLAFDSATELLHKHSLFR
ncbi:serine/threonine-protein kinase haspin [Monodelphis domestica]|uniref:serine/threonine-protein kinase haspin n=1 Tax=Monodelphis domestica TaxID=13616 RepID=UPI0024E1E466|nr:serine/threonine-protein kinase haspin [Monodelphis domestica]